MSAPAELLPDVMTDQGTIATDRLAKVLHITKAELATATGLSRDAVSKRDRLGSRQTQARLRDTVEPKRSKIICRALPRVALRDRPRAGAAFRRPGLSCAQPPLGLRPDLR